VSLFDMFGLGIKRAKGAVEAAIREEDRHRNIGLKAIERGRVMVGITLAFRHMVDDYRLSRLAHLVTKRRLDLKFASGCQAQSHLIVSGEADPAIVGDAGYS